MNSNSSLEMYIVVYTRLRLGALSFHLSSKVVGNYLGCFDTHGCKGNPSLSIQRGGVPWAESLVHYLSISLLVLGLVPDHSHNFPLDDKTKSPPLSFASSYYQWVKAPCVDEHPFDAKA